MTYTWVYIVLGALGAITALALVVGYFKQGTVKAALQTVELLRQQVITLTSEKEDLAKKVEVLTTTMSILQGQVTQAAPVRELASKQAERHEENILLLTRLEGSLSRVESKLMRGE